MIAHAEIDACVVEELVRHASSRTGFRHDAILSEAIRKMVRKRLASGSTIEQVLLEARGGASEMVVALREAVSVGETFFFRQPEHFEFIAQHASASPPSRPIRAWSAGCATGEEAYSLAACLLASSSEPRSIEVLGTDLLERNVAQAREAVFGPRSVRVSGPLLYPVVRPAHAGAPPHSAPDLRVRVAEHVRAITSFEAHNLLEPAPRAVFDVILCRNVLMYFARDAARAAIEHLARALAPGGVLVFGPFDVEETPEGLVAIGPPGAPIYARGGAVAHIPPMAASQRSGPAPQKVNAPTRRRSSAPPKRSANDGAATPPVSPPIALHVRILEHIERGQRAAAEEALDELRRSAPEYVPGILEHALWSRRNGQHARCRALASEVLRRARALPEDARVEGPEALSARFYVVSAETLLGLHDTKGAGK